MDRVERLKRRLIALRDEINAHHGSEKVAFNQQDAEKANMSFSGCNGRIWIQPAPERYDVSLSGKSLEAQLTEPFNRLFGKPFDGYKQPNANKGTYTQPYWRTSDFELVRQAAFKYADTRK